MRSLSLTIAVIKIGVSDHCSGVRLPKHQRGSRAVTKVAVVQIQDTLVVNNRLPPPRVEGNTTSGHEGTKAEAQG